MQTRKIINGDPFISYTKETYSEAEMLQKSTQFILHFDKRITCRNFSDKPIAGIAIEDIVLSASTAKSGTHKQP